MITLYVLIWNSLSISAIINQGVFFSWKVTHCVYWSLVAAILAVCYDDMTCAKGNTVSRWSHNVHNDHSTVPDYNKMKNYRHINIVRGALTHVVWDPPFLCGTGNWLVSFWGGATHLREFMGCWLLYIVMTEYYNN